jgi:hypothetical protein
MQTVFGWRIEPVDLMVAVGVFATVTAGILLFVATGGAAGWGFSSGPSVQLGPASEAEWIQPVLGQAIVDSVLLERKASTEVRSAASALNRAVMAGHLGADSREGTAEISRSFAGMETAHAARVQFVTGRFIVESTIRGVRTGALANAQTAAAFNSRIVSVGRQNQDRMERAFRDARQANIGQAIVVDTLAQIRMKERTQQDIGSAIVRVLKVQNDYQGALAQAQTQLASAALVAVRSEQMADRFAALAAGDRSAAQATATAEPRSWPEVSFGLLLAGSFALVCLFGVGLLMPAQEDTAVQPTIREEPAQSVYRRAV